MPHASLCFLMFLIPEKLKNKYSQNWKRKLFYEVLHRKTPEARRGAAGGPQGAHTLPRRALIRPICITILYHNLLLFIDIFHIMDMILMLFPLFCMYDDYEGNNCRSQILMEKHRQDTIFMKIRSFGKSYFTEFCTRRRR